MRHRDISKLEKEMDTSNSGFVTIFRCVECGTLDRCSLEWARKNSYKVRCLECAQKVKKET